MGFKCQMLLTPTQDGVFRSGQILEGVLKFNVGKPTTFSSIIVRLKSKGKCFWRDVDDSYMGIEKFVVLEKEILRHSVSYARSESSNIRFQFTVPKNIPSSFKSKICTIKYEIVAVFTKTGVFSSPKKIKTQIPVCGNVVPCSKQPLIFRMTKKPFSLTNNASIDTKMEIEKTFLRPGDEIKLCFSIRNNTDVPMTGIKVELIEVITYKSNSGYTHVVKTPIKVGHVPGVGANTESFLSGALPTLPNLYSVQFSKILLVEYKLKVTAKYPFPHLDSTAKVPVVIGEGIRSSEKEINFK